MRINDADLPPAAVAVVISCCDAVPSILVNKTRCVA